MSEFSTIVYDLTDGVAVIRLNRPEIRNAFNEYMIAELNEVFLSSKERGDIRALVITGEGKSFCAGADLNWMKKMKGYSFDENLKDSLALADLMYNIHTFPHPVIGKINGAAIGGGTGLVAACDIAIASENAKFSFSEVKLGLVPACISPYVIMRVGFSRANRLFLTGERFEAPKALEYGLIDDVVPNGSLDEAIEKTLSQVLNSGPNAITTSKELLRTIGGYDYDYLKRYTAEVIAKLRISDEGQEGLTSFLEKRKPRWADK